MWEITPHEGKCKEDNLNFWHEQKMCELVRNQGGFMRNGGWTQNGWL